MVVDGVAIAAYDESGKKTALHAKWPCKMDSLLIFSGYNARNCINYTNSGAVAYQAERLVSAFSSLCSSCGITAYIRPATFTAGLEDAVYTCAVSTTHPSASITHQAQTYCGLKGLQEATAWAFPSVNAVPALTPDSLRKGLSTCLSNHYRRDGQRLRMVAQEEADSAAAAAAAAAALPAPLEFDRRRNDGGTRGDHARAYADALVDKVLEYLLEGSEDFDEREMNALADLRALIYSNRVNTYTDTREFTPDAALKMFRGLLELRAAREEGRIVPLNCYAPRRFDQLGERSLATQ